MVAPLALLVALRSRSYLRRGKLHCDNIVATRHLHAEASQRTLFLVRVLAYSDTALIAFGADVSRDRSIAMEGKQALIDPRSAISVARLAGVLPPITRANRHRVVPRVSGRDSSNNLAVLMSGCPESARPESLGP